MSIMLYGYVSWNLINNIVNNNILRKPELNLISFRVIQLLIENCGFLMSNFRLFGLIPFLILIILSYYNIIKCTTKSILLISNNSFMIIIGHISDLGRKPKSEVEIGG